MNILNFVRNLFTKQHGPQKVLAEAVKKQQLNGGVLDLSANIAGRERFLKKQQQREYSAKEFIDMGKISIEKKEPEKVEELTLDTLPTILKEALEAKNKLPKSLRGRVPLDISKNAVAKKTVTRPTLDERLKKAQESIEAQVLPTGVDPNQIIDYYTKKVKGPKSSRAVTRSVKSKTKKSFKKTAKKSKSSTKSNKRGKKNEL